METILMDHFMSGACNYYSKDCGLVFIVLLSIKSLSKCVLQILVPHTKAF